MWARRRRRRIYVLGCLGVWWGLEKEISGIIEYGALNEWMKENQDLGPTTDLSVCCSTAMKSRSDDKTKPICEEGPNWFLPVWNHQWTMVILLGEELRLKEEKQ